MRSLSVFEDLGRGLSRLERPGYWQPRQVGVAFSPHELETDAGTLHPRRRDKGENHFEGDACGLTGIR